MEDIKYSLLITGTLPIDPFMQYHGELKHLCTTTLIYRVRENIPVSFSGIICDPGWTNKTEEQQVCTNIRETGLTLDDIGYVFISHNHLDHFQALMSSNLLDKTIRIDYTTISQIDDVTLINVPGHSQTCLALCFISGGKKICVAGDAVINKEYLLQWEVYRPNGYSDVQIAQTRKSMKFLIDNFDVIIPGHGGEIKVTDELKQRIANTV